MNARSMLSETLGCSDHAQHHDMAHVLLAVVRMAAFFDIPSTGGTSTLAGLLQDMGVAVDGQYLLDFVRDEGVSDPSEPVFAPAFPHVGRFQGFLAQDLGDQFGFAAQDLEAVSEGFSSVLSGLLDMPSMELDYGDCQLVASGCRFLEAVFYLQAVIDLNADIYRIESRADGWLNGGVPQPYRLFCGLHPDLIVQGQPSTSGREGLLNSANYLDSLATLDTSSTAQELLDDMQDALLRCLDDFKRGMQYEDDGNSGDDALYVDADARNTFDLALPWFDNVRQALAGGPSDIPDWSFWDGPDYVELPGFVLDENLVFSSFTYSGRVFLPDYSGLPDTVATTDSFDRVFLSDIPQLYFGLTGKTLQRQDVLIYWNSLNVAWDEGWVGWALESDY